MAWSGQLCRKLLPLLALAAFSMPAEAGWLTLRNDSPGPLVVVEVIKAADGALRRGRPARLLPGETIREFRAGPPSIWLEIYDMQAPARLLYSGPVAWKEANVQLSITSDGKSASVRPIPSISGMIAKEK